MQSKYSEYDINLSPKEKLDNKIYKYEKALGIDLCEESNKESNLYRFEWNYMEHMGNSKEFTEEEKAIMDRCYEVGKEYFAQGGGILDKLEDWGEITQARTWCKKIYKDVCMPLLKWVNPNKVYAPGEREYEAKQMAKRLIEFCLNEEQHKELVETWNRLYSNSKLDGYSYDEKCDIIVGILSEKIGVEKTAFINAYMYLSEEHKEDMQLLRNYTYEEMGLE